MDYREGESESERERERESKAALVIKANICNEGGRVSYCQSGAPEHHGKGIQSISEI